MKMTEKLSEDILGDVRQNVGADNENDDSFDDDINTMSGNDVFESFMEWNGIIGYTNLIKKAIQEIYNVKLDNVEHEKKEAPSYYQGI